LISIVRNVLARKECPVQKVFMNSSGDSENKDDDNLFELSNLVLKNVQNHFGNITLDIDYIQGSFYDRDAWEKVGQVHIITSLTADHWLPPPNNAEVRNQKGCHQSNLERLLTGRTNIIEPKAWSKAQSDLLDFIAAALYTGGMYHCGGLVQVGSHFPADLGYQFLYHSFEEHAADFSVDFNSYFPTSTERLLSSAKKRDKLRMIDTREPLRIIECAVSAEFFPNKIPSENFKEVASKLAAVVTSWSKWKIASAVDQDGQNIPEEIVTAIYRKLEEKFMEHIQNVPVPKYGFLPYHYRFDRFVKL
jgi:hypothetical protein